MTDFTWCPGECDKKVGIADGDVISWCCVPCWNVYYINNMRPDLRDISTHADPGPLPPQHSEGCRSRQMSRVHEPVVEDREFTIRTKS